MNRYETVLYTSNVFNQGSTEFRFVVKGEYNQSQVRVELQHKNGPIWCRLLGRSNPVRYFERMQLAKRHIVNRTATLGRLAQHGHYLSQCREVRK